jgi:hypothetical protein
LAVAMALCGLRACSQGADPVPLSLNWLSRAPFSKSCLALRIDSHC